MEINKKMYKYTAIISMTIVLILIFNLIKPMLAIADTTYGISSINYDKNDAVMFVTCTRLDEHVNSFLYWVSTEEDIPTKDNLDELAVWCVKNAIKVVPLNSTSISDSIKIRKTGKYYAIMLLKKANEEGTEEYVKAFVATYVVNTPIKEDDFKEEDVEEEIAGNDEEIIEEPEQQPSQEPEKEPEQQPSQEPEKEPEQQPSQEPEKEPEQQPSQEPEKEPEQQPSQETGKEPGQQPSQEINSESDDEEPIYVRVDKETDSNGKDDEYEDIEGASQELQNGNNSELEKNDEDKKQEENQIEEIAKEIEKENEENMSEAEKETKLDELPNLTDIEFENQAQEAIPQTGSNDITLIIIGIITFSIIGLGSFIKYMKVK